MEIIGLDLHKRASQLAIKADDGAVTDRRIAISRERQGGCARDDPPLNWLASRTNTPAASRGDLVRLADFIDQSSELILAEWVAFASTCGPVGRTMNVADLRDHAKEMLQSISADLRTPQTDAEQKSKSTGDAPPEVAAEGADTAAEVHGAGRAESGFTLAEMVSEYRALRASVIRLWTKASGSLTGDDLDDLTRFNEAIDQLLAESITRYAQDLEKSKETFLAILGHDLRTPLGAVITSAQFMIDTGDLTEPGLALATRIVHSAKRMNAMVGDLLDFTRGQLGAGVPITRAPMDLGTEAGLAVAEVAAARPDAIVQLNTSGDLSGDWDCSRLHQVMSNLLGSAVQHGAAQTPISVTVRGEKNDVLLRVHNRGAAIPRAELSELFSPFKGAGVEDAGLDTSSLGLGLYIAERIVTAHSGTIYVSSSAETGTLFTVRLPRSVKPTPA